MTRKGFSLIELLIVIAIIGVLVAILMPAIMAAREASCRTQCGNNLRQFGVALNGYHETHGSLPPITSANASATWFVLMLPFMEQSAGIGWQWNSQLPYDQQSNDARAVSMATFICPSRRSGSVGLSTFGDDSSGTHLAGTLSDYAGNIGATKLDAPAYNGVFQNSGVRLEDVLDGCSNTIMVGEKNVPFIAFGRAPLDNSVLNGGVSKSSIRAYHNSPYSIDGGLATGLHDQGWKFGSCHPGVVQFVYCDGHVEGLRINTDAKMAKSLFVINDGQSPHPTGTFFGLPSAKNIIILVDKSGSMDAMFPDVRTEVKEFLEYIMANIPDAHIEGIAYNHQAVSGLGSLQPLTPQLIQQFDDILDTMTASGGTNLQSGMVVAANEVVAFGEPVSLYIVTDAVDFSIQQMVADMSGTQAMFGGVEVHVYGTVPRLFNGGSPTPANTFEQRFKELCDGLGGSFGGAP